ncbi:hypothetical protein [Streptomyces axinellae]
MTARKPEQRPTRVHAARQVRPTPPMSELLASCAAAAAVSRPPSEPSADEAAGEAEGAIEPTALPQLPVNVPDKGAA